MGGSQKYIPLKPCPQWPASSHQAPLPSSVDQVADGVGAFITESPPLAPRAGSGCLQHMLYPNSNTVKGLLQPIKHSYTDWTILNSLSVKSTSCVLPRAPVC